MRLVIVESPYAGDVVRNVEYAKACIRDCLSRGESPYASHLFFTQPGLLDDNDVEQRCLGIAAGLAWGDKADASVVYADLGISRGMHHGMNRAYAAKRPVEVRYLSPGKPWQPGLAEHDEETAGLAQSSAWRDTPARSPTRPPAWPTTIPGGCDA